MSNRASASLIGLLAKEQDEPYREQTFYDYMRKVRETQAANNRRYTNCEDLEVFPIAPTQLDRPVQSENERRAYQRALSASAYRTKAAIFNYNVLEGFQAHAPQKTLTDLDQKIIQKYADYRKKMLDLEAPNGGTAVSTGQTGPGGYGPKAPAVSGGGQPGGLSSSSSSGGSSPDGGGGGGSGSSSAGARMLFDVNPSNQQFLLDQSTFGLMSAAAAQASESSSSGLVGVDGFNRPSMSIEAVYDVTESKQPYNPVVASSGDFQQMGKLQNVDDVVNIMTNQVRYSIDQTKAAVDAVNAQIQQQEQQIAQQRAQQLEPSPEAIAALESAKAQLASMEDSLKQALKLKQDTDERQAALTNQQEEQLNELRAKHEADLRALTDRIKQLVQEKMALSSNRSASKQQVDTISAQLRGLGDRCNQLKLKYKQDEDDQLEQHRLLIAQIAADDRDAEEKRAEIDSVNGEIARLEANIASLPRALADLRSQGDSAAARKRHMDATAAQQAIIKLQKDRELLEIQAEYNSTLSALQSEQQKFSSLQPGPDFQKITARIKEVEQDKARAQAKLSEVERQHAAQASAHAAELSSARQQLQDGEQQLAQLNTQIEEVEAASNQNFYENQPILVALEQQRSEIEAANEELIRVTTEKTEAMGREALESRQQIGSRQNEVLKAQSALAETQANANAALDNLDKDATAVQHVISELDSEVRQINEEMKRVTEETVLKGRAKEEAIKKLREEALQGQQMRDEALAALAAIKDASAKELAERESERQQAAAAASSAQMEASAAQDDVSREAEKQVAEDAADPEELANAENESKLEAVPSPGFQMPEDPTDSMYVPDPIVSQISDRWTASGKPSRFGPSINNDQEPMLQADLENQKMIDLEKARRKIKLGAAKEFGSQIADRVDTAASSSPPIDTSNRYEAPKSKLTTRFGPMVSQVNESEPMQLADLENQKHIDLQSAIKHAQKSALQHASSTLEQRKRQELASVPHEVAASEAPNPITDSIKQIAENAPVPVEIAPSSKSDRGRPVSAKPANATQFVPIGKRTKKSIEKPKSSAKEKVESTKLKVVPADKVLEEGQRKLDEARERNRRSKANPADKKAKEDRIELAQAQLDALAGKAAIKKQLAAKPKAKKTDATKDWSFKEFPKSSAAASTPASMPIFSAGMKKPPKPHPQSANLQRFQLLHSMREEGNDSPEVRNELRTLTESLIKKRLVKKKAGEALLRELSEPAPK